MSKKDRGKGMKVVQICIGSACHLKGSYEVLGIFQSLIKTYNLEDKLVLKQHFVQAIAWRLSLYKNGTGPFFHLIKTMQRKLSYLRYYLTYKQEMRLCGSLIF